MSQAYEDRTAAGHALAVALAGVVPPHSDVLVLALPRGGVPVAAPVVKQLAAVKGFRTELDLIIVRKLGSPWNPELAMGAIASGGVQVLNPDVITDNQISREEIELAAHEERIELARRELAYRGQRPPPHIRDRTVILVDDGIATGATMLAAIEAVRGQHPKMLIVAVPVAPAETIARLKAVADEVVCPLVPEILYAIGQWYRDFQQTSDEEVVALLREAWETESP